MRCLCGNIIVDQTDNLPYKGEFFADQDYDAYYGSLIDFLTAFITARESGKEEEFIEEHFTSAYPKNVKLLDIINDTIAASSAAFNHTMYECEVCGRIWMQTIARNNVFVPYFPETEYRGILRGRDTMEPTTPNLPLDERQE